MKDASNESQTDFTNATASVKMQDWIWNYKVIAYNK